MSTKPNPDRVLGGRYADTARETDASWDTYGALLLVSGGIAFGVFVACGQWHDAWASLTLEQLARKGSEPLAAQYPWLSAIVAALIALFVGRMLIFFSRLESR